MGHLLNIKIIYLDQRHSPESSFFTMSMTTHSQPLPTREKGGSGVLNDFFLSQLLDQRAQIRLQNVIEHEI